MESEDSLRFIIEALGSLVESNGFLINLPMGAIIDATPLHRVTSYQARSAVILTFDTTDTRDRVWKAARAVKPNTNFSGRTEDYFTEIAKSTKTRRQKHSKEEHQEMESDTKNTQEEKRTVKLKKRSKEKSQAVILATKLKNKYSALDECAEKRKKKGGYSYGSTSEKLRLMREGSVETVTTPTAESSDANTPAADDLPTLVRDISSMVPVSNIDKTQARHQGGQNFFESTRLDDENAVEACLREETRLVEEVERIRD